MKYKIICVGKSKHAFLAEAEFEYAKRLKPYAQLEIIETEVRSKENDERIIELEAQKIMGLINPRACVLALDQHGKKFTSEDFAAWLKKQTVSGFNEFQFIIGGPLGLSPAIKKTSKLLLSLSDLTFTYQFARLLLVEQLYRAATINAGTSYHK